MSENDLLQRLAERGFLSLPEDDTEIAALLAEKDGEA